MSEQDTPHGIKVELQDSVAIWTINRPDRRNALARATVRELGRLAREARDDDSIRAVVICGEGDQAFCAGADLKERQSMSEDEVRDFLSLYRVSFGSIDRLPKPVFAAIDGVAYGGGLELALACDFRVMSDAAKVGLTEVSLAIIPGAGGTQRLTRIVGEARAKELILFAQRLSAAEALALGIVHRVASNPQRARDLAIELANQLADSAPVAVAAALEAIDGAGDLDLDAGLLHERRCYERTLATEDRLEALAAFRDKRAPQYKGH